MPVLCRSQIPEDILVTWLTINDKATDKFPGAMDKEICKSERKTINKHINAILKITIVRLLILSSLRLS